MSPSTPAPAASPRRFEPWPWILTAMLVAMISGSLGFLAIAIQNPDPEVVDDAFAASERIARSAGAPPAEDPR